MNPIHKIINSSYDSQNVKSKILSINLRIDGLSFVIMESEIIFKAECYEWQSKGWEYATEQIKLIFEKNTVFQSEFKKTIIILKTKESTLVPSKFYDKNKEAVLLKTLLGIDNFDTYSHNLKNAEAVLVSAVHPRLKSLIKESFPKVEIFNYSTIFIDKAIKLSTKKETLLLDVGQQSFEIAATRSGKIISHNYFDFITVDEFMFFLLSFVKQNNIDLERVQLLISGKIALESNIGKSLKKYFHNIEQMLSDSKNDKEEAFAELKNYTLIANS